MKIRLDCFLADPEMMKMFAGMFVRQVWSPRSDHCLLVARVRSLVDDDGPKRHHFMYEDAWHKEDLYDAAVVDGWCNGAGGNGLLGLNEALMQMQGCLTDWKTKKFGDIRRKIKKARKEYEKERRDSLFWGPSSRERELARHLSDPLHRQEI